MQINNDRSSWGKREAIQSMPNLPEWCSPMLYQTLLENPVKARTAMGQWLLDNIEVLPVSPRYEGKTDNWLDLVISAVRVKPKKDRAKLKEEFTAMRTPKIIDLLASGESFHIDDLWEAYGFISVETQVLGWMLFGAGCLFDCWLPSSAHMSAYLLVGYEIPRNIRAPVITMAGIHLHSFPST